MFVHLVGSVSKMFSSGRLKQGEELQNTWQGLREAVALEGGGGFPSASTSFPFLCINCRLLLTGLYSRSAASPTALQLSSFLKERMAGTKLLRAESASITQAHIAPMAMARLPGGKESIS